MKPRPNGFLSEENIDHRSEIFDYICELHDYLWKFVKMNDPSASGNLRDFIDKSLENLQSKRVSMNEFIDRYKDDVWNECGGYTSRHNLETMLHDYARVMCDEQRAICANFAMMIYQIDDNGIEHDDPVILRSSIEDALYPEELR